MMAKPSSPAPSAPRNFAYQQGYRSSPRPSPSSTTSPAATPPAPAHALPPSILIILILIFILLILRLILNSIVLPFFSLSLALFSGLWNGQVPGLFLRVGGAEACGEEGQAA